MGKDRHIHTHVCTYSRPITKYSTLPLRLNFDEYSGLYGSCMPSSPLGSICTLGKMYNEVCTPMLWLCSGLVCGH